MKSSTLIRSMLSKENMDVIENLSSGIENDVKDAIQETPEEYVRPEGEKSSEASFANKAQEIDMLWQNFKTAQFSNQSPAVYATMGFVGGVITTLVFVGVFGYFASKPDVKISLPHFSMISSKLNNVFKSENTEPTLNAQVGYENEQFSAKVVVPDENGEPQVAQTSSADNDSEIRKETTSSSISNTKKHTVADGETVEGIIKRYYGSYTPERAEKIKQANNLASLDRISIGQELIIPEINE